MFIQVREMVWHRKSSSEVWGYIGATATGSRPQVRGVARIIAQRRRSNRTGWCGWRSPRHVIEIEKLQQIGLRGIAGSQMGGGADKSVLDKLDHRRVVHRGVRNIVPARKRRHDHVRQAKAKLCRKALDSGGVTGIGAGLVLREIAM